MRVDILRYSNKHYLPDLIAFFLCGSYEHHPVVEKASAFLLAPDQTAGLNKTQNINNPQHLKH